MSDSAVLLSSLYDIQQQYSSTQTIIDASAPRCTVDVANRTISIPKNIDSLGVQYDHRSKELYFEIDRYVNGVDLLTQVCVVQWINGDIERGNMGFYPIVLYDNSSSEKLTLVWEIYNESTQIAGDLHFALRFYTLNDKRTFEWSFNTLPAKSIIKDTLDVQMESTIDIEPSTLSIWNYRIASLERMATEAVNIASDYALESQAWAIGHPSHPQRAVDNSKYYKEMTQAIYNTTNEELHERVYNEGKKIADKLWLLPDEETIIRLDDEYTIGVPTATTEKRGVVIVGDGTKIVDDVLSVDTSFNETENLENLVSEENFKTLLTKLAKAVSVTIGLNENAVLKAMMSNVNINDENKIPTSKYIYTLAERIGIDVELTGDTSLTDGTNKLPQLREDIDNLVDRIYTNNVEDFISFTEKCPLGLTIFTTSETTTNLPNEDNVWINASGILFKMSNFDSRIILFNKEYTQIATLSYIEGFWNTWTVGVCQNDVEIIRNNINSINMSISNINININTLSTTIEAVQNEFNGKVEVLNNDIDTVEQNYKLADDAINSEIDIIQNNYVDLSNRVFNLEKYDTEVKSSLETLFSDYSTIDSVDEKLSNQKEAFNTTLEDYAKTETVNTQISNLETSFNTTLKDYSTTNTVNTQIDNLETSFNTTLKSYSTTTTVNKQISDLETSVNTKLKDYSTTEIVNKQISDLETETNDQINDINESLKDYAKTETVNTQISNLETSFNEQIVDINESLKDYAKTETVNTQVSNLESSINTKLESYSTTEEIGSIIDQSIKDFMPLANGSLENGKITSEPIEDTDIVNKAYVDNFVSESITEHEEKYIITESIVNLTNLGDASMISCDKFIRFIFSGETTVDFDIVDGEDFGTTVIGTLPEGIEIYNDIFERVIYIMGYGTCLLSIVNGEISITYEQTIPAGTKIRIYEIIVKKQNENNNENTEGEEV